MSIVLADVMSESRLGHVLGKMQLREFIEMLLRTGQYDVFQRFLDSLLDDGKIGRDSYEKIASLVVKFMWTEDIEERQALADEISALLRKHVKNES